MFEALPWRPFPIYLRNPKEDREDIISGCIKINDVNILGEYQVSDGTMSWDAQNFQNILEEKLGDNPVKSMILIIT